MSFRSNFRSTRAKFPYFVHLYRRPNRKRVRKRFVQQLWCEKLNGLHTHQMSNSAKTRETIKIEEVLIELIAHNVETHHCFCVCGDWGTDSFNSILIKLKLNWENRAEKSDQVIHISCYDSSVAVSLCFWQARAFERLKFDSILYLLSTGGGPGTRISFFVVFILLQDSPLCSRIIIATIQSSMIV